MWNWDGFHSAWGGMGIGMLGMGLLWIVVIVAVVVVAWNLGRRSGGSDGGSQQTPLDILKASYARGEIDKEEFERKRRDLQS